jgi:hypothetical protein
MKKIILWSLGGLFALGIVTVVVLMFFLGNIVKAGVNSFGPKITGTNVVLSGATVSPLTGSGTLTGLTVANPPGWKKDNAFVLGKIHLSVAPFSILGDHIVINEILIDAPEFDYETKVVDSNIAQLMANIEKIAGSGSATATSKSGKPVKFEVKKFRLTNAKIAVGVGGVAAVTVPMPDISMDDLGTKEGGITPDQLVGTVMKKVSGSVITAGKDAVLKAGGAVGDAAKDAAKGVGDAAKGAVDGIKGLFGGDKK